MYEKIEVTPEEENEIIMNIAEKVHQSGMEMAATIMLESMRPLIFLGTQMGRFYLSPFLPAFGKNVGMSGEKFFQVFEKHGNIEKLIEAVDKLKREEEIIKKEKKAKEIARKSAGMGSENVSKKRGWRSLIPFLKVVSL